MVEERIESIFKINGLTSFFKKWSIVEYKVALKTGIAAALSLFLGTLLSSLLPDSNHLIGATWCVLATFVVMQADLETTYYTAWIRFLGTFIGSAMGILFTSLFGSNPLSLCISITLTILICTLFSLNESIRIACLSVAVVLILKGTNPETSTWTFGVYRFLDSVLGISVGVFVARFFWPSKVTQKLRTQSAKLLDLFNNLISPFPEFSTPILQAISLALDEQIETIKVAKMEFSHDITTTHEWEELHHILERIFNSVSVTTHLQKIDHIFDHRLSETVQEILRNIQTILHALEIMISDGTNPSTRIDFPPLLERLDQDLLRFRETHATRRLVRSEVENFFVFFYSLRTLIKELRVLEEKIFSINQQPRS